MLILFDKFARFIATGEMSSSEDNISGAQPSPQSEAPLNDDILTQITTPNNEPYVKLEESPNPSISPITAPVPRPLRTLEYPPKDSISPATTPDPELCSELNTPLETSVSSIELLHDEAYIKLEEHSKTIVSHIAPFSLEVSAKPEISQSNDSVQTGRETSDGSGNPNALTLPAPKTEDAKKPSGNQMKELQLVNWLTQDNPVIDYHEIVHRANVLYARGVCANGRVKKYSWLARKFRAIAKKNNELGERVRQCGIRGRAQRIREGHSWLDDRSERLDAEAERISDENVGVIKEEEVDTYYSQDNSRTFPLPNLNPDSKPPSNSNMTIPTGSDPPRLITDTALRQQFVKEFSAILRYRQGRQEQWATFSAGKGAYFKHSLGEEFLRPEMERIKQ
ncbi:hypothetical protein B7494_g6605 [Chlorociboria aeruginascens]|nr:hypothetical protein B7494_g6605 [Chlorociboria aeruginascens]